MRAIFLLLVLLMNEVQGGIWTGDQTSVQGLNKPFWAKLTAYDGTKFYAWTQYVPAPTASFAAYGAVEGGKHGTLTINPAYEPNNATIGVPKYAWIQRAYYVPDNDWVYVVVSWSNDDCIEVVTDVYCRQNADGSSELVVTKVTICGVRVVTDDGGGGGAGSSSSSSSSSDSSSSSSSRS